MARRPALPVYGYHGRPASIRTIANAFTQGLEYVDGVLYEGTGLNGRSSIRKVKLETGEVLQQRDVAGAVLRRGHHRLEVAI